MPSPRPLGSGVWKILILPHHLEYQIFYFVTFPPYSTEPRVGSFDRGLFHRFILRGPSLGFALLWAIATNVSHLIAIIALHLGQTSLAHLLLALMIPFMWFEGWFGRVVYAPSLVFLSASAFHFPFVRVVVQDIFCIR